MPNSRNSEASHDDSMGDFAAHLQRRLGVTRAELGECLTQYRPARPYSIVLGNDTCQSPESAAG